MTAASVKNQPAQNRVPNRNFFPDMEQLEKRELPAAGTGALSVVVTNPYPADLGGNTLVIRAVNVAANVEVSQSKDSIFVKLAGVSRRWSYPANGVDRIEFNGGPGNDRFVNNTNLSSIAYGNEGNDYLAGGGRNDMLYGGAGDDVLLGMADNDQLFGGDGHDRLNGGSGNDQLFGGAGDDLLIAIDNAFVDFAQGDGGRDVFWMDRSGAATDSIDDATDDDKLQFVNGFANGADRTLDGDRLTDPTIRKGQGYKRFDGPLFAAAGPSADDIRQGNLGDCWLLAGLAALAYDEPAVLRENVVSFDDGTFGVHLGGNFYRVDNDLPVAGKTLAYARLGQENSLWVAIVEKAFAIYRTGTNNYASLDGGYGVEVNSAFGARVPGNSNFDSFASADALANELLQLWQSHEAVTIGFADWRYACAPLPNAPVINYHMYTLASVTTDAAGTLTAITLRNPWGRDGAGRDGNASDGLVTLTPALLFSFMAVVNWGRV